jgi:RHS repeat-associated protein
MTNKSIFVPLIIFMLIAIIAPKTYANEPSVFGPKNLEIGSFRLHLSRHSFSAQTPSDGVLTIKKNTSELAINTGFLFFNGTFIALKSFLSGNDIQFSEELTLAASNHLTIFLGGTPGASVNIKIESAVSPIPPPVIDFSAYPDSILQGESAVLVWETTHADTIEIDPEIGMVVENGSMTVSPAETTTYTLTATGSGGSVSDQITIAVVATPQVGLVVSDTEVDYGESVTLSWSADGYDTVFIKDGSVITEELPNGSRLVTPEYTTIYSLSATNADGPIFLTASVKVLGHHPEPQPDGSFGKQYADLIPEDASLPSYNVERMIVITGLVTDIAGNPLTGVTTKILDHPEYGTAVTDETGRFSIPAEGGDTLTIVYQKESFLSGQRKVRTGHNDIIVAETIALIEPDPNATTFTFDDNPSTIITHKSTPVIDAFGSRSCSTVFRGNNRAYEVDSNGNMLRELTTITTRSTEYTTPESMPAELPPRSAYTYCVELSVDGVKNVRFSDPIVVWVDNFLGFDVGEVIPAGFYNRDRGFWEPSDNGTVVKLLDTNTDTIVDALDANGDDQPDDLNNNGSFIDEVIGLEDSQQYIPDTTYWRVETTHFTPGDWNLPSGTPQAATWPNSTFAPESDQNSAGNEACYGNYTASLVEERGRIVHENLPIPGTDISLHYASNRVEGHSTVITVPASGEMVPDVLKRIEVTVNIAGTVQKQELPPEPDQVAEFFWDGLDYLDRPLETPIPAHVTVGFVYDSIYYSAGNFDQAFGQPGVESTEIPARQEIILTKSDRLMIHPSRSKGTKDFADGWTISNHHHMNLQDLSTLHKGDGTTVSNNARMIERFAGTGNLYPLGFPNKVAVDTQGSVYAALDAYGVIYKIDPNGTLNNLVGVYQGWGFSGDGGPAVEARIEGCGGIAVDNNRNIYFSDVGNSCIRKIDANGIINTIAGIPGSSGYSGDNGPARQALFHSPKGIAVDNIGNLYIADSDNDRIRKIDTNGIITTIAGGNGAGHSGDGGLAINAQIYRPDGIAIDHAGNIYTTAATAYGPHVIRRIDTSGIITTFAGTSSRGFSGDGGIATKAQLFNPRDVAVDNVGNIYIADDGNSRIRMVNTNGIITTVAGSGVYAYDIKTGPATLANLRHPLGVAVDDNGNIFIADNTNHLIKKVTIPSSLKNTIMTGGNVFSEENIQGHVISAAGLHTKTVDLHTGNAFWSFEYDDNSRLVSIIDRFGNETVISRNENGVPVSMTSPDGIITMVDIDENNHLNRITYADGASYEFEYEPEGLMTNKIEPEGNQFGHQFDPSGRLAFVTDEEGGTWTYSKERYANGDTLVQVISAEGNNTLYRDVTESTGAYVSTITGPADAETLYSRSGDGLRVTKSTPCGMAYSFRKNIDSEYQYEFVREMIETTPAGLERITVKDKIYTPDYSTGSIDSIIETITVNGKTTTTEDNLESQKIVTSPEARTATVLYNPDTLQAYSIAIPGLYETIYSYDDRGRLGSVVTGIREITYDYNNQGFLESITDAGNQTISYAYDEIGRVTRIDLPDSSSVWFSYDSNGNMTVLTNQNIIEHGFGYNQVNLNDSYQTPISGSYSLQYDRDRQLTQISFPSGKQINNIYDATRLMQVQTSEGNIDYTYLCGDRVESITNGNNGITYGYDGRFLISEILSGTLSQSLFYEYNDDFDLTAFTYAGDTADYSYDNDGLMTGVGIFTIIRNVDNGLPESVNSLSFNLNRTFNGYGEVEAESSIVNMQDFSSWNLTRDNNGRITQKIESVAGVTSDYAYTYDAMGRLLTVIIDSTLVEEYQYNVNGTRTYEMNSLRDIAGRSYTYSNEDHLLTAGNVSYQYDPDGFLISKTNGADVTQYDYSSRGELLNVILPDGKYVEYIYDPLGRRIAKKMNSTISEKYLWQDMTRLLAVYDGNDNLLMRFEYADGRMPLSMIKEGIRYYLSYDPVGSLKAVADSSGNMLKNIVYDSFGNIINDSNSILKIPFGFAGGLHDKDTNLIRFGYRDYDPDIGRWTAKDPIFFEGGNIDLYGYCLNDPINAFDLIGLQIYGAANAGFAGINYSTNTQNLSQASLTTGSGVIVGGSLSIGYDFGKGLFGDITHDLLGQDFINIGLGKYLGISIAPDLSKVELNFGLGIALPVSYTFPIRDDTWEPINPIFGHILYDYFHNTPCR